jgi:hypothetical protein
MEARATLQRSVVRSREGDRSQAQVLSPVAATAGASNGRLPYAPPRAGLMAPCDLLLAPTPLSAARHS